MSSHSRTSSGGRSGEKALWQHGSWLGGLALVIAWEPWRAVTHLRPSAPAQVQAQTSAQEMFLVMERRKKQEQQGS